MKKYLLLFLFLYTFNALAQTNDTADKKAIQNVLKAQRIAWSKHDIEKYMEGYWKSDSLKFFGTSGITYGWKNTLQRYKKAYPTAEHTGKLNFKINDIVKINDGAYYVLGDFHIKRNLGNASGIFMVIFKNINGEWKIIADMSV